MTDNNNNDKRKLSEESQNKSNLRALLKKRWFLPSIYLGVAAILMIGVLWVQADRSDKQSLQSNKNDVVFGDKDSAPVNGTTEVFNWPVTDKKAVGVIQPFYDVNGSTEDQEAALVNYDHSFVQNKGVNIGTKDNKSFTVTAAMSGKVTKAEKDALLGYIVTINHGKGIETIYNSLQTLDVKKGQQVAQGEKLGKAGTEDFNRAAGTHLHFEIRKNNMAVNPEKYFSKGLSALNNVKKPSTEATNAGAKETTETPKKQKPEQKPSQKKDGKSDTKQDKKSGSETDQSTNDEGANS
ncbi:MULTISPECIES: M23 family metallopeptidase [Terrilactibacillus]|nr:MULTISPECIES: M23 family metallopeptidase [Terrilactibacillus]